MARRKNSSRVVVEPSIAVLYARVSTPEQAERDLSLPAQLDALRKHAAANGIRIEREYIEPGVSATDDNRPEFLRMMTDLLRPESKVGTVLVTHTSRYMRNAMKARMHKAALKRRGIRVVSIQQTFADDAQGHFVEGMFELMDQLESETNGIRTRAAMIENAKRGFFNGSEPPYGFTIVKVAGPGGELKPKLDIEPKEIEGLREAFRCYVGERGAKSVARELNQRGVRYRGRLWNNALVLKVIGETAAVGRFFWGKKDTRRGTERPPEEWILVPCPRIIDDELFQLAAEVRGRRDPIRNPGRASSSPLLLARLACCAGCGSSLQLETGTSKTKKSYRYYNCRNFCRTGREACKGQRIRVDVLDRVVLNHVAEHLFTEEKCRAILGDFLEEHGSLRQKTAAQRKQFEIDHGELQRRLTNLLEKIETEPELAELTVERLRELKAKRDDVARKLAALTPPPSLPPYLYKAETIQKFRDAVRATFTDPESDVTRGYLHRLIDKIVVSDEEIVVEAKTGAVVAAMAAAGSGGLPQGGEAVSDGVLAHVVSWRAREDSNFRLSVP